MKKSFLQQGRRPEQPPADAIARFESGGPGQDTKNAPHLAIAPQTAAAGPTLRLSLDLPERLHRRFKAACASNGSKMVAEAVEIIEKRTEELERKAQAQH